MWSMTREDCLTSHSIEQPQQHRGGEDAQNRPLHGDVEGGEGGVGDLPHPVAS